MDNKTKWLLVAGVAGVGLWWWYTQGSAMASLAAHVSPAPTPGSGTTADQVTTPMVSTSGGTVAISPTQAAITSQAQMTAALLAWAPSSKNPPLYEQMINQLSPSDLSGLYNLLTTYWAGKTAEPTPAQVTFWNNLRLEYPFLNTGGVGCSNLACN
jgi:hypothetical protein